MRPVPPPFVRHQPEEIIAKSRAELAQRRRSQADFNREIERARLSIAQSRELLLRIEKVLSRRG